MEHITTPFGRRSLSLGMVAAQVAARDVEGKAAHKWKTLRAITESKDALGLSDRSLAVLDALLTFLPETAMSPGQLTVFPSNRALAARAHGMSESTLRRCLGALVDAALIVRRDSPNGKRYARKGDAEGRGERVFGLDLTPILARAAEFDELAARSATAKRDAALARERITILRRDIGKMIQIGEARGDAVEWASHRAAYAGLCRRLPRSVDATVVAPLADDLEALATIVDKSLVSLVHDRDSNGNDTQSDAQIQRSKTEANSEIEPAIDEGGTGRSSHKALPLGLVLRACPDIAMYARDGITTWKDLVSTAELVRGMLGVSASAWRDARDAMGDDIASVALAGILQRADAIRSPGGYMRGLTGKARAGAFSAWPMVLALLKAVPPPARVEGAGGRRALIQGSGGMAGPQAAG